MTKWLAAIQQTMGRFKRSMGLPDSIGILGLIRMCPILAFVSLLLLVAVGVMVLG